MSKIRQKVIIFENNEYRKIILAIIVPALHASEDSSLIDEFTKKICFSSNANPSHVESIKQVAAFSERLEVVEN